jgi:hypothetical protein
MVENNWVSQMQEADTLDNAIRNNLEALGYVE